MANFNYKKQDFYSYEELEKLLEDHSNFNKKEFSVDLSKYKLLEEYTELEKNLNDLTAKYSDLETKHNNFSELFKDYKGEADPYSVIQDFVSKDKELIAQKEKKVKDIVSNGAKSDEDLQYLFENIS